MQYRERNVTTLTGINSIFELTLQLQFRPNLRPRDSGIYNPKVPTVAHWCSWLTRCPLKAEITGSSPVCATNYFSYIAANQPARKPVAEN